MRIGRSSGTRSLGRRSGMSSSSSSPPARRWLFERRVPSTSTRPSSTSLSAAARDPSSVSPARKRSSRSPAACGGTAKRDLPTGLGDRPANARLALGGDKRGEQDGDADDDERVGEVEGGPEAQVEKVGHVAEPESVDEVRQAPADQEPERHR